MRKSFHRVTSTPEQPPGSVAGHELQKGWCPAWMQQHMLKSSATTQKSLGATSGGQRGMVIPNPSGSQLMVLYQGTGLGAA